MASCVSNDHNGLKWSLHILQYIHMHCPHLLSLLYIVPKMHTSFVFMEQTAQNMLNMTATTIHVTYPPHRWIQQFWVESCCTSVTNDHVIVSSGVSRQKLWQYKPLYQKFCVIGPMFAWLWYIMAASFQKWHACMNCLSVVTCYPQISIFNLVNQSRNSCNHILLMSVDCEIISLCWQISFSFNANELYTK